MYHPGREIAQLSKISLNQTGKTQYLPKVSKSQITQFTFFSTILLDSGASGGVYALVGAHIANVLMNFKEMRFGIPRTIILGVLVATDLIR